MPLDLPPTKYIDTRCLEVADIFEPSVLVHSYYQFLFREDFPENLQYRKFNLQSFVLSFAEVVNQYELKKQFSFFH